MPKDSSLKRNHLNVSVLPPVGGGKENDFTYSRHLAKLLRRFVRFALPSQEEISFSDRELLDDVMRYGSLKEIARLRHVSEASLCRRVKEVLESLDATVDRWEQTASSDQLARITRLEQQLSDATALNAQLQAQVDKLAEYNRILTVAKAQEAELNEQYRRMNRSRGRSHTHWA